MKTKFAKRFLVALAVVACISAFCVLGACGTSVAGTYTYDYVNGFAQEETAQFVLDKDGTATLTFPGAEFLASDVYVGTYTNDGTTVTIEGLYEEDGASNYPGLWTTWIDSSNGNCKIEVDKKAGTFEPYFFETTDTGNSDSGDTEGGSDGNESTESGAQVVATYVYAETKSKMGSEATENSTLVLYDDGTCTLASDSYVSSVAGPYTGTYVMIDNDGVYISGLTDETLGDIPGSDAAMGYSYVLNCQCKVKIKESDGTFEPVVICGIYTYTESVHTDYFDSDETHELVLYGDNTCTLHNLGAFMPTLSAIYYGSYTADTSDSNKITVSSLADASGSAIPGTEAEMGFSYVTNQGFTAVLRTETTAEGEDGGQVATTTYTFEPETTTSAGDGDNET